MSDSKILDRYLGKSIFKKDQRKEELLNDRVDLEIWVNNMLYATIVSSFDSLSLDKYQEEIIKKASDVFIDVIENLRSTSRVLYPDYFKNQKSLWYIAAYPDVVDYYFPGLKKYRKTNLSPTAQADEVLKLQKKRAEEIEKFEARTFPEVESGVSPTVEEYFIALKDFYKQKRKLLLST